MNINKIAKYFAIGILFILYFNILVACLEDDEDDEESIWKSSETNIIPNISESHLDIQNAIPDSSMEVGGVLEPSLEENFVGANEKSVWIELTVPDNSTEEYSLPNRILLNDTPVLLSTGSSTVDVEKIPEVSLLFTSHDEIPSPKHTAQTENIPTNISTQFFAGDEKNDTAIVPDIESIEKNDTAEKSEDIPSFSEWAQKRLEEVQKSEQNNITFKAPSQNGKGNNSKLRWKNYASLDCGAKVVGSNPETISPGSILSPAVDEYKLSPCTSRIWFVVELCEAIQAQRIDIANYELFSSSPKEFTVLVSERYPTRDWTLVGKFEAKDERNIQSFDIETQIFGKYIKVEIKSHYGSEHYCPISLFKAYGMSVYEVLQKEDSGNANHVEDDDDDDEEDNLFSAKNGVEKNIFSSATDAVISMVKRAAQVLGNKVDNQTTNTNKSLSNALVNTCSCPRHLIICNNCTETLLGQIYELLSCKSDTIRKLIGLPPIYRALTGSASCSKFGYRNSNGRDDSRLESFFPEKYVGAMCNEMAISEQQGVLNVSQHFPNITSDLTNDKIISMDVKEVVDLQGKPNKTGIDVTEQPGNTTIHSATVDTSQIKPTKTLTVDPNTTTTPVPEDLVPANPETAPPNPETAPFFDADPTPDVDLSNETMETALDEQMESVDSSTVVVTASPQAPKESIFLRLSNRIKALERNVSLSSQYLEELSKRYKKQVEEMQNLSEKTIAVLREESQERLESKQKLEERLDQLAAAVDTLVAERRSFFLLVYFFLFVGIVGSVYYFFCGATEGAVQISRRLSDEDALRRPKERKKRRPSDQVLKIVRYSSVNEDERSRRSKKRKKKVSKRSHSAGSLKLKIDDDWVTGTQQVIEDHAPFVLDESDHVISEPLNLPEQEEQEEDRDSAQRVQIVIEENRHGGVETNSTCRSPSNGVEGIKKEKRGLKRFLKKVF